MNSKVDHFFYAVAYISIRSLPFSLLHYIFRTHLFWSHTLSYVFCFTTDSPVTTSLFVPLTGG